MDQPGTRDVNTTGSNSGTKQGNSNQTGSKTPNSAASYNLARRAYELDCCKDYHFKHVPNLHCKTYIAQLSLQKSA